MLVLAFLLVRNILSSLIVSLILFINFSKLDHVFRSPPDRRPVDFANRTTGLCPHGNFGLLEASWTMTQFLRCDLHQALGNSVLVVHKRLCNGRTPEAVSSDLKVGRKTDIVFVPVRSRTAILFELLKANEKVSSESLMQICIIVREHPSIE